MKINLSQITLFNRRCFSETVYYELENTNNCAILSIDL